MNCAQVAAPRGGDADSMGKSARSLGRDFGLTARDMNALLKKHGYLNGGPGAYGLTEKGKHYGEEQYNDNGYGGFAYRGWETRTWNDNTAAALKADMKANPGGSGAEETLSALADVQEYEPLADHSGKEDNISSQIDVKAVAFVGAVVGVILVARHVKPFWHNNLKPAAKKVRNKFAEQEPVEADALEGWESRE